MVKYPVKEEGLIVGINPPSEVEYTLCKQYAHATHTGFVKDRNEDSFLVDVGAGVYIVSDGLGGHEHGDMASLLAVTTISQNIQDGASLGEAISAAHQKIRDTGKDMGATAVVLSLKKNQYEVAWVGDSRAYLYDGELHQITHDHTYIQRLVDEGEMSKQEAQAHPDRSYLSQALGTSNHEGVTPDTVPGQLRQGEYMLLCSDGLTDEVDEEKIASVLGEDGSRDQKASRLVQLALDNGGSDNVTVVLV